jgi:flagellar hook-associated protein 3 FlgL
MSGRITPAMITTSTLDNINSALANMERTSEELSSGKRIHEPSDNPYGTSQVIDLESQLDGLKSYESNAQDGIAWQNTASGAMTTMAQAAQRVRELLVKAANGTENATDLNTISLEVEQLTASIKQAANTQYAGQYVFAGTRTTTPPYEQGANDEYQGNEETISRAVGPAATVNISTNISTVLGNGKEAADGGLLDTLRTITEHLQGGTAADQEEIGSTDLNALDANIEKLTQLQAIAGSSTDQMETALSRNEGFQSSFTESLANTDATNIAEASIAFANEQAAYTAALRAGGNIVQESLLNFLQ